MNFGLTLISTIISISIILLVIILGLIMDSEFCAIGERIPFGSGKNTTM